jgi:flagellar biosynthesis/type III secretory pathway chaperone
MGLNQKNGRLIASSLAGLGRALDFLESFFISDTYLSTGLRGGKARKGTRLREGV